MVKVALLGTGGMGTVHYNNYKHIDDCEVVALVGIPEQSQAAADAWGLPLFEDIASMAAQVQADVVDICSPTFLHKEHVLQALGQGMHAITEKPVALHKQDAQEMYALADRMGKQLYVAQVIQFTKPSQILRGLVRSGEYGKALDAHFERLTGCPRWIQNGWLFDREKSGLLPFDLHIHDLDLIVSLFGRPESFTYSSCAGEGKSYQEHYRFLYRYADMNVAAEAAWFNADFPFTARWRVYFENAVVVNDGVNVIAYQFDHEPRVFDTEDVPKIPTGINLPPTGWFITELSHFMDCIRKNEPSPLVTREQVLSVVGLLEEISAAS